MKHIKFAVMNEYGEIDIIYGDEESLHCVLLTEYIKSKDLIKDNVTLDFNDPNNMSLYLRELGNIIFLNKTSYKKIIKSGESGIFVMPDYLSTNQKEKLLDFNQYINDFEEIEIWYEFASHSECKNLYTVNKNQVKTILEYYKNNIYKEKAIEISDKKTK